MPRYFVSIGCLIALFFLYYGVVFGGDKISAKSFADQNGKLDSEQAALFIAYHDDVPLSKFITAEAAAQGASAVVDKKKIVEAMSDKLDDLRDLTKHEPPWSWEELDKVYAERDTPRWKKIKGLTKEKEVGGPKVAGLGPLLLRKDTDNIGKAFAKAGGASVGYSQNHLKTSSGALNSEGVLDYPVTWEVINAGAGWGGRLKFDLATAWNVAQEQDDPTKDVQELTFATPLTFFLTGNLGTKLPSPEKRVSEALIFQVKPYYQTDFDLEHKIYGVEGNIEYEGNLWGLHFGSFYEILTTGLQYQLRIVPKIDYSVTDHGGVYTKRVKGDDWTRIGGLGAFAVRYGLGKTQAVDLGVSYSFFDAVSGSGGFSKLFKAYTTLWIIENIGATFEYSKGDTPVADQPVDLVKLGLEFKY